MLVGEDLHKYLIDRGMTREHIKTHENGLMSCWECCEIVVSGKTKKELAEEWEQKMKEMAKEMGLE